MRQYLALFLLCSLFISYNNISFAGQKPVIPDSLPDVMARHSRDAVESRLRNEAIMHFHNRVLPDNRQDWILHKQKLRENIINSAGIQVNHTLPVDIRQTGVIRMNGYEIRKIYFQTRPGIYATANLFVPEGKGPFPAVVAMIGHWRPAKIDTAGVQQIGHTLAANGYVCLTIDPWGAGERATVHGDFEYHGAHLGASLLNVGETLLGMQVTDNIRAVDLLTSLPFVDAENIGATGASGGGNQTMWFSAIDERVKAVVPIVSVGTFESAVMRSNCVCELLPDGLTFTETAGVLGLIAPRALKMCNHNQDASPTFFPDEMLRSYHNARPVFALYGKEQNITYQRFDLTHGYYPQDREAMLGWFDLHLKGKGDGSPVKETPFSLVPMEELMVFKPGRRDTLITTTHDYVKAKGNELRKSYLSQQRFDPQQKRKELAAILKTGSFSGPKKVNVLTRSGAWQRIILETHDGKSIPVLIRSPTSDSKEYVLLAHAEGKDKIPLQRIEELLKTGKGIVIMEFSGTGELISPADLLSHGLARFHTLARAEMWLGKTLLGEWVEELGTVIHYLTASVKTGPVHMEGWKEGALAALFYTAMTPENISGLSLTMLPVSYLPDRREGLDFFGLSVYLPRFLHWGDISLAAALTGKPVTLKNPVTLTGNDLNPQQKAVLRSEFDTIRKTARQLGNSTWE